MVQKYQGYAPDGYRGAFASPNLCRNGFRELRTLGVLPSVLKNSVFGKLFVGFAVSGKARVPFACAFMAAIAIAKEYIRPSQF